MEALFQDPIAYAERMAKALANPASSKPVAAREAGIVPKEFRRQVFNLQDFMANNVPSTLEDCTLRHFFAPGCYGREMTIPKGTLIIGKIHKHAHLNIISKGRARVITEFGPMEIVAPYTFVSAPGTKRIVLAEEEVIWTTIHVTEETDLEKIEDVVIAKSYDELGLIDAQEVQKLERGVV